MLLQILLILRYERQLVESIDRNLLHCWFERLSSDDPVWDQLTLSGNRDRLINEGLGRAFFEQVKGLADWRKLTFMKRVPRRRFMKAPPPFAPLAGVLSSSRCVASART